MKFRKNLDVILYEKIRESFLRGEFKLGEKIDIDKLAEKYEVSRTPIIQAIKRLESEGMMEAGRGGKMLVPSFTPKEVRELYEVRVLLEQHAIKRICDSSHKVDFTLMKKYAKECADAYREHDIFRANKADMAFHREIVKMANNGCLLNFYNKVQGQCMVVNYLLDRISDECYRRYEKEHKKIIESMENFELENSYFLIEHHLNRSLEKLVELLPETNS